MGYMTRSNLSLFDQYLDVDALTSRAASTSAYPVPFRHTFTSTMPANILITGAAGYMYEFQANETGVS